jgi:beta-lactamase regulating signal transducer with metallopeptidase domain
MLTWMLLSTTFGAVLAFAALLLEPTASRFGLPTRLLWSGVIAGTVAWSSWIGTSAGKDGPAREVSSPTNTPKKGTLSSTESGLPSGRDASIAAAPHAAGLSESSPRSLRADLLLLALWFLASFICFAILAYSAWRIGRMRRQWAERVVARVPVLVSHDVGPAVIGVVHHGIVVPAWIESLDLASQHTVMVHEREHVRAGDPLLLWGTTVVVALMPWNAALWFALGRVRHAIEIDCDARVLRAGKDTHAYCSLLLDVSQRTLAGAAPVAALAEPSTLLERRVEAMVNPRTFGWRSVANAAVAVSLVAVACRAPRPEVSPRAAAAQVARELIALLATESGKTSLSANERARLGAALGFSDPVPPPSETATPMPDYMAIVDSMDTEEVGHHLDDALQTYYPSLGTNTDTTPALLGIVFDNGYRVVRRHALRRGGTPYGDVATVLRDMGLDTISARTSSLGFGRRFASRVNFVFATEGRGPVSGTTTLRAVFHEPDSLNALHDETRMARRGGSLP